MTATPKRSKYAQYVPERDYISNNYQPMGKKEGFDLCGSCIEYYNDLHDRGLTETPFPPNCSKHVLAPLRYLRREDFETEEEFQSVRLSFDPIAWAAAEMDWEPRWYQEEMLSCTSQKKLYRCGRRLGKTVCMVIQALHHVAHHEHHQVLIIAPFEAQIQMIFDEMNKWLDKSITLMNSRSRYTKSPNHRMEFKNGSRILGFSSGANSSTRSDKIRGQDAHLIVIDEIDFIADSDLDAIQAILASHADCQLVAASTPQGWRKKFYAYATNKDLGWKEFWFISAEAPTWTMLQERQFRGEYSEAGYHHEFNAEFAESEDGVFKKDASMIPSKSMRWMRSTLFLGTCTCWE